MPRLVRTRLSAMMLLFYFSLGAWVVTLSTFLMSAPIRGGLNFTTAEVGLVYSTFAFGGMLAPLAIGVLTDRLFRAERVLGAACLASAALLMLAGRTCDETFPRMDSAYRAAAEVRLVDGRPALEQLARLDAHEVPDAEVGPLRERVRAALDDVNDDPTVRRVAADAFTRLFLLMLAYCVCTQLALTLTTVVALRNLPEPAHTFAHVRLFGTVGWIAAGLAVGWFLRPDAGDVLYLAAAGAAVTGAYVLTLPPTPPRGTGRSAAEVFGLPALRLFLDRSFVVFVLVAFVATTMNQFYVVYGHRYLSDLGVPRAVQVMTLAQVMEVGCMFALPVLAPGRRMKLLLAVGLGGYAVRGLVMAVGWVPAVVALGVPMHGWGYAFFFVVAATYIDREAPPHLRGSAQGIITFVAGGIGALAGNIVAGWVVDRYRVGTVIDWRPVWEVPLAVCAATLVVFLALFHPPPEREGKASA